MHLKSPHILMEPSFFTTGTMGAAQSENFIGTITPSFCSRSPQHLHENARHKELAELVYSEAGHLE